MSSNRIGRIQTNATYSIVAGGQGNSIGTSSTRGTIGGGYFNSIATNAEYATVPGGKDAIASHYGQFAYASGRMVYPGDAQTSMYVLRTAVNASTFSSLYLDANSLMLTVPSNSVWGFEVMVVGALAGGPAAVYKFTGAIRNFGGTVAFVGTPTKTVVAEDAAASAWDAQVVVNYGALDIQGKGGGTGYVSWVATVHTTEVTPYY